MIDQSKDLINSNLFNHEWRNEKVRIISLFLVEESMLKGNGSLLNNYNSGNWKEYEELFRITGVDILDTIDPKSKI